MSKISKSNKSKAKEKGVVFLRLVGVAWILVSKADRGCDVTRSHEYSQAGQMCFSRDLGYLAHSTHDTSTGLPMTAWGATIQFNQPIISTFVDKI